MHLVEVINGFIYNRYRCGEEEINEQIKKLMNGEDEGTTFPFSSH